MTFQRLKWYEWLILAVLFAAGYFLITYQRVFVPEFFRFFTAFLILFIIITPFFFIVKPQNSFALSRLLAFTLGLTVTLLVIIMHFIISHDFLLRYLVLPAYSIIVPFLSGWVYQIFKRKK